MSIIDFVITQVQTNQFAQAALIAAPATAMTYMARSVPMSVYHFFKRLISVDVRFNSDMPEFESVARYISKDIVRTGLSRNFTYQVEAKWNPEDSNEEINHHGLTAGYGTHYGMFRRSPVVVNRYLDESNATSQFKEHITCTFFTRRKKTVELFAAEVAKHAGENVDKFTTVPVFINSSRNWNKLGKLPMRQMTSVFSANNAGDRIVDIVRAFEAKKAEHHRLGLPHHLGIMLHGEPGCGKSSLIHAIATELERSIFYLNLGSITEDSDLTSLLAGNRDWSKIILAVEDIDAAGVKVSKRKKEKDQEKDEQDSPLTLSALLNSLDGILCPDGLVVIATTNHLADLDPALKREGRFDHTIELGKLGYADFERMAKMFGRNPQDFDVANDIEMSGAAMRALVIGAAA